MNAITPTGDRPAYLLHRLSYRLGDHLAVEAEKRGLTTQLAMALRFVELELSMRDLALCLRCEASNLTGIVDRLVQRGLVVRIPDPDDGRVKRAQLTDAGRETLDEITDAFEDFAPIAQLSERDRAQLTKLLTKTLDAGGDTGHSS